MDMKDIIYRVWSLAIRDSNLDYHFSTRRPENTSNNSQCRFQCCRFGLVGPIVALGASPQCQAIDDPHRLLWCDHGI